MYITCHLVCTKTSLWFNAIRSSLKLDLDPIFLSREIIFPRHDQLSLTPPGTDYFGETALKTRHPTPVNTMRKSHTFAALVQAHIAT